MICCAVIGDLPELAILARVANPAYYTRVISTQPPFLITHPAEATERADAS